MAKQEIKLIANNKKAHHDYFLEEKYEAGVELHGTEVKSLRMGKCSIKEAFVRIEKGEVIIYGMHISPYEKGNIFNKDPLRPKKLLMHKSEIRKLVGKIKNSTTRDRISPRRICAARRSVILRSATLVREKPSAVSRSIRYGCIRQLENMGL